MKKFIILAIICLSVLSIFTVGCTNTQKDITDGVTFTDALNRNVTIAKNPKNVVVLQGSFAKTWLLAGGEIKGVTIDAFEDLNLDLPDATIVGTVKDPNLETIISLNPDFVIMSSDIAGHIEIAKSLDSMKIDYAYFKQESFEDYLGMLKIMTDITAQPDLYKTNGLDIQKVVDNVRELAKNQTDKPSVLFVRARSQGVSAKATDHMVCTMLEEFGCENIASSDNSLLENLSIEQVIAKDPDIILVTFMGDEEKAKAYLKKEWESTPKWSELSAVKNNNYIFLEKSLYHFKPNELWGKAYENLYQILFQ